MPSAVQDALEDDALVVADELELEELAVARDRDLEVQGLVLDRHQQLLRLVGRGAVEGAVPDDEGDELGLAVHVEGVVAGDLGVELQLVLGLDLGGLGSDLGRKSRREGQDREQGEHQASVLHFETPLRDTSVSLPIYVNSGAEVPPRLIRPRICLSPRFLIFFGFIPHDPTPLSRRRRTRMKKALPLALIALFVLAGASACRKPETPPAADAAAAKGQPTMNVTKAPFGSLPDGTAVDIYTLTNAHGLKARIMTYGAILVSLELPDRTGALADCVLGYDSARRLSQEQPLLRRDRRPLRQPHRQGPLHPRRQDVHAGHQQRRQPPARRAEGLRQGRLDGRAVRGGRRGRRQAHATSAGTARKATPATSTSPWSTYADQRQRAADRLRRPRPTRPRRST